MRSMKSSASYLQDLEQEAKPRSGLTRICWRVSKDTRFENTALVVIIANAAWIGIDLDWNNPGTNELPFIIGENVFCCIFTLELITKWFGYVPKSAFLFDRGGDGGSCRFMGWNLFDLFLVLLMIVETWIVAPLMTGDTGMNQLSTLRLLRLLRISRVFRLVPELGMMVKSMGAAARSVSSTLVLAIGIMYVFAIILTQWAKTGGRLDKCVADGEICFDYYFGTIGKSLLSLMQILVYDDTFSLIRPTMDEAWHIGALLILFICVGSFTVLNMLIGVICEIVGVTTTEEKEKVLRARVREVFAQLDADHDGGISREEFTEKLDLLEKLGIDQALVRSAFDIIDVNESDMLELDEFIKMIFKLLHPPEAQDLMKINQKLDRICESVDVDPANPALVGNGSATTGKMSRPSSWPADAPSPQKLEELLLNHTDRLASLEVEVRALTESITRSGAVILPKGYESHLNEDVGCPESLGQFMRMQLAHLSAQLARQSNQIMRLERTCAYCEGKDIVHQTFSSSAEKQTPEFVYDKQTVPASAVVQQDHVQDVQIHDPEATSSGKNFCGSCVAQGAQRDRSMGTIHVDEIDTEDHTHSRI